MLAEKSLQSSLHEKDRLLSEIFHRTGNNMQMICSLLYLQAAKYSDINVDRIVEETSNRIQTMALVHQLLYSAGSISLVNLNELAAEIASFLLQKYSELSGSVSFDSEVADITLSFDLAIPTGLVLYELLSNSLMYAFAGGNTGRIKLKIEKNGADELLISYSDDGTGLPETIDIEDDNSILGLRLVTYLVRDQLAGNLTMDNDGGFSCSIRFRALDRTSVRV